MQNVPWYVEYIVVLLKAFMLRCTQHSSFAYTPEISLILAGTAGTMLWNGRDGLGDDASDCVRRKDSASHQPHVAQLS